MKIRICDIKNENEAARLIAVTGADPASVGIMAPKSLMFNLLIEDVDNRAAAVIKQDMLSLGGDAAVSWKVSCFKKGRSCVLVMATGKQIEKLAQKLRAQPFGLSDISERIERSVSNYTKENFVIKSGSKRLTLGGVPVVMGILNVTPDSFSDSGMFFKKGSAVQRAFEIVQCGAGILDIGGESTRPGAKPVSEKEELARILPVLKNVAGKIKAMISVDTYKPSVARACINEGADMVNDITSLSYADGAMAKVAREKKVPVVLMHMRGRPRTMQKNPVYGDVVSEIMDYFTGVTALAVKKGISADKIIIDPGIGFGKTANHNLELIKRLREFRALGFPILTGTSRKSFIGKVLERPEPGERDFGSAAAAVLSVLNGASIVRVHDVKATVDSLKMLNAVERGIAWNC
jgi:dihydropteroate synthase